jgi:hypothetical protein
VDGLDKVFYLGLKHDTLLFNICQAHMFGFWRTGPEWVL